MYFDRFDICEAWSIWAHDYGEYAVITRLNRMGFRLSPMREHYADLSENGQAIYDALVARESGVK